VSVIRKHPIIWVIGVLGIVFLWLPIAVVVVNGFNGDASMVRWGGATLGWFRRAASDGQVQAGLITSLELGLATAVLSIVVALTGVLWWRKASPRGRRVFDAFVYSRLVLPEVVLATALFLVFTRIGFQLNMLTAVLGHTVWASAFATVIIEARARMLSQELEEAAADLGAAPLGVLVRVTLPGLAPAILAAGILAFSLSFDDVVTTFFLSGSRMTTLPLLILGFIRFRVTPEVNAIGALVTSSMIASTLLVLWLVVGLSARGKESITDRLGL
jgi:ABC-type spermidine/putrescine transport system permease subunit II